MSAPVEASMAALRRLSVARWRYLVSTRNSPVSLERESKFRLCSCKYCVSTASQLQRCHDSEEFGRKDGVECESASGLSHGRSATTSLAWRNRHTVSPTFSSLLGRSFNEGGGLPGLVLHSRHLAVKAKKTKSKVENVESIEDVAQTAKGNAVRMMETALDILSREHSKLRTGRASAGMLDHITVEAHGVRTPLSHLAAVTVSGLQTLNVLPYDASIVKEVEKAILNSPMGLNPQVDGATMTVPLPRLTKEHCETMCKLVSKAGESAKLTIRRARKEALDVVKNSGDLSKDEMKRFEKDVEELTKKYTKSIDETCKNKEKEIMA